MKAVIRQLLHRYARQTRVNGVLCLHSDGNPLLVEAFAAAGWTDPQPIASADAAPPEAATVQAPERAVEARPDGHVV